MKKLVLILSVLLIFAACKSEPKPVQVKYVTSLHCDGCKTTISNKLAKTEGVLNYEVTVDTKEVEIKYDENITDSLKLKNILVDLGYTAKVIK